MIKNINYDNITFGIIISGNFNKDGVHFFTENHLSQQLAYMKHPKGKIIEPHVHKPNIRKVKYTQEVLVLRKGKLRVDFYNDCQEYLESHIMHSGDVILLIKGGHGFKVLEPIEMFEIKQGPFMGEQDKVRFKPLKDSEIKVIS